MEAAELKTKFHDLIDLIEDHDVLEDFYRALNDYNRHSDSDIIDELSELQQIRLKESIRQSDSGNTVPHDTVKNEIKRWLMK
ncbi:MAG: hypothetical protein GY757_22220 [bacterium]|nr:hypothetical protein [bacterium]